MWLHCSEIPLLWPPKIKTFYPLKTLFAKFKLFFSSFSLRPLLDSPKGGLYIGILQYFQGPNQREWIIEIKVNKQFSNKRKRKGPDHNTSTHTHTHTHTNMKMWSSQSMTLTSGSHSFYFRKEIPCINQRTLCCVLDLQLTASYLTSSVRYMTNSWLQVT